MLKNLCYALMFMLMAVQIEVRCQDIIQTVTYMRHFGFMTANRTLTEAIRLMQRYAGIAETGVMDEQTQAVMQMPRCGSEQPEILRGLFQGSRWTIRNISYNILNYPKYLEKEKVDEVIAKAFSEWSRVIDFQFSKTNDSPTHTINFDYHPEVENMRDGQILASANYPIHGGHINFSRSIRWSTDTVSNGEDQNLYTTAVHEIGHTLGLLHSSYPNSIMSPYVYDLPTNKFALHPSDNSRLKQLYQIFGPQTLTRNATFTEPVTDPNWSICNLTKMDAIIAYDQNTVYVFNGDRYWLLDAWTDDITFKQENHSKKITKSWKNAPSTFDAAFVGFENATYFFSGSQCWKYPSGQGTLAPGYPKDISEEFPGITGDIDAAVKRNDETIYFFKGDKYWKFNRNVDPAVSPDYPKVITRWGDLPRNIDAALYFPEYNLQDVYFFKDMLYYKYPADSTATIRKFPRPTTSWWFNC